MLASALRRQEVSEVDAFERHSWKSRAPIVFYGWDTRATFYPRTYHLPVTDRSPSDWAKKKINRLDTIWFEETKQAFLLAHNNSKSVERCLKAAQMSVSLSRSCLFPLPSRAQTATSTSPDALASLDSLSCTNDQIDSGSLCRRH
mmetsp:Transcript_52512/g.111910  ORF Transcript_52512/g.111910 Transcript_52512/m.111910 type:complete len:145 (+) Transcript_52512:264-698(+)